jgi:hypothetical protein
MMKIRSSAQDRRPDLDRVRQPSEEASHCANKAAERALGGLLTEVAGRNSENETVN